MGCLWWGLGLAVPCGVVEAQRQREDLLSRRTSPCRTPIPTSMDGVLAGTGLALSFRSSLGLRRCGGPSRLHPQLWSRVENSVPYPCRSVI